MNAILFYLIFMGKKKRQVLNRGGGWGGVGWILNAIAHYKARVETSNAPIKNEC